jgi:hypothetical protein
MGDRDLTGPECVQWLRTQGRRDEADNLERDLKQLAFLEEAAAKPKAEEAMTETAMAEYRKAHPFN